MTRLERENNIERYLAGKMSGPEEEEFFLQVAADRTLRQELKAYRLVEQAMEGESRALSTTHTSLRAYVQGLVATTGISDTIESASESSAGKNTQIAKDAITSTTSSSGSSASPLTIFTTAQLKWLATLLTAGATVATVALVDLSGNKDESLNSPATIDTITDWEKSSPPYQQLPSTSLSESEEIQNRSATEQSVNQPSLPLTVAPQDRNNADNQSIAAPLPSTANTRGEGDIAHPVLIDSTKDRSKDSTGLGIKFHGPRQQ